MVGMGEVYKARDTRLARTVAIKVLSGRFATDPDFRSRFEREAHLVSRLNHPNICTIYDIGRHGEVDYLVIEFIEGESLVGRLKSGPLPQDQALEIALQAAQALTHAHQQRIVHRDVKPANVMLTRSGTVKVLDFGVAKIQEPADASRSGAELGTLAYMAPEQLRGEPARPSTDVWSLGCLLHEMLAGSRPFRGDTDAALVANIVSGRPRPLDPAVPPAIQGVVERALAKDPARRYPSAAEFADAVAGCRSAAPVPVPSPRKRRWMAAGVAALIGFVAVSALAVTILRQGELGRWAREDALREIAGLVEADRYTAAYAAAERPEP